jgi:alpha-tubulin suppressor-like RCC1 family protein
MTTKILGSQIENASINTEQLSANITAAFVSTSLLTEYATSAQFADFAISLGPRIISVNIANSSFAESQNASINISGGHIVVTGNNFATGATVLIDNTSASSVSTINSNRLNVQVPARPAATYNLYVVNPDGGTGIKVNGIQYGTGTLWGMGSNGGVFGRNNTVATNSPVQVGAGTNWISIGGGLSHILAIRSDNTLWAWGSNSYGQLGRNNTTSASSPVQIGTDNNWSTVSVGGGGTSFAVRKNGTLWGWGGNANGNLGVNDIFNKSSPVQVGTDTNWSKAFTNWHGSTVRSYSHAVKTDGTLWAWGNNFWPNLGIVPVTGADRSSPVQIGAGGFIEVAIGEAHALALRSDGTLWSWGYNSGGQLGRGQPFAGLLNASAPVQIGSGYSKIAAAGNFTYAIDTGGRIYQCGGAVNTSGENGENNQNQWRSSLTQLGALTNWRDVRITCQTGAVPRGHVSAIKTDGTLWGWGHNGYGQLGDSTTSANRSSPIQIGTQNYWSSLMKVSGSTITLNNIK